MLRSRAAAHASRAANAAYRSAGGPRAFSWLQCLGSSDDCGPDRLYLFVVSTSQASPATLYHFATRSDQRAVPFDQAPHCLQVAVRSFVGVVRALEPMVQIAADAEHDARRRAIGGQQARVANAGGIQ